MGLFGKKRLVQALAEVLEDGRAKSNTEMSRLKYKHYAGAEPMLKIAVRVQPENEPPFEASMKAGLSTTFLILPGVRVLVQYDPARKEEVTLLDESKAILDRNPQLLKRE